MGNAAQLNGPAARVLNVKQGGLFFHSEARPTAATRHEAATAAHNTAYQ